MRCYAVVSIRDRKLLIMHVCWLIVYLQISDYLYLSHLNPKTSPAGSQENLNWFYLSRLNASIFLTTETARCSLHASEAKWAPTPTNSLCVLGMPASSKASLYFWMHYFRLLIPVPSSIHLGKYWLQELPAAALLPSSFTTCTASLQKARHAKGAVAPPLLLFPTSLPRKIKQNRQFKHQTLTQTQTVISLPNIWKADLCRTQTLG